MEIKNFSVRPVLCKKNVSACNTYFHFGIPFHPEHVVSPSQIIY